MGGQLRAVLCLLAPKQVSWFLRVRYHTLCMNSDSLSMRLIPLVVHVFSLLRNLEMSSHANEVFYCTNNAFRILDGQTMPPISWPMLVCISRDWKRSTQNTNSVWSCFTISLPKYVPFSIHEIRCIKCIFLECLMDQNATIGIGNTSVPQCDDNGTAMAQIKYEMKF